MSAAAIREAATVDGAAPRAGRFHVQSVPPDLGATGFAALDANGQAAACAVTLNGPFGSGHSARYRRGAGGIAGIARRHFQRFPHAHDRHGSAGQVTLAGAGSGGPNGSAAMAYALLKRGAGPA